MKLLILTSLCLSTAAFASFTSTKDLLASCAGFVDEKRIEASLFMNVSDFCIDEEATKFKGILSWDVGSGTRASSAIINFGPDTYSARSTDQQIQINFEQYYPGGVHGASITVKENSESRTAPMSCAILDYTLTCPAHD